MLFFLLQNGWCMWTIHCNGSISIYLPLLLISH